MTLVAGVQGHVLLIASFDVVKHSMFKHPSHKESQGT